MAEKHGGATALDNLTWACPHCNRYKGPNIAGIDAESGDVVRLFHPRFDTWEGHFRMSGSRIVGHSAVGRVTAEVLAMNAPDMISIRSEILRNGEL